MKGACDSVATLVDQTGVVQTWRLTLDIATRFRELSENLLAGKIAGAGERYRALS